MAVVKGNPVTTKALRFTLYLALIVTSLTMLVPFYWMVCTSLKVQANIFTSPPQWLPKNWVFQNYIKLWTVLPFDKFFFNSVIVAVAITLANIFFDTLAAYAFAKLSFPGRDVIFLIFLVTLMVPFQVNIIPLYKIMGLFGWIDTYWGLIVPTITSAFGVFLMRQYIQSIPNELLDAARMDGCSEFKIFWRIVAPLSKPGVATLTIFTFMGAWNSFLWPLIITSSMDMRTLPVGLALLQSKHTIPWPLIMAGATISALPMVVVFLLMQRKFIEGLTAGAVKG